MVRRGNLAVFEGSSNSETGKVMPTKIGVHACYIPLPSKTAKFPFLTMSEREIWPFLRVAVSPKLESSRPPKLVYMHVTSTPICMNFLN